MLEKPTNLAGEVSDGEWQRFLSRATFDEMYFELQILDEPDDESD